MPEKLGNGGHSQENYDPNTGKYVADGESNKYYNNPNERKQLSQNVEQSSKKRWYVVNNTNGNLLDEEPIYADTEEEAYKIAEQKHGRLGDELAIVEDEEEQEEDIAPEDEAKKAGELYNMDFSDNMPENYSPMNEFSGPEDSNESYAQIEAKKQAEADENKTFTDRKGNSYTKEEVYKLIDDAIKTVNEFADNMFGSHRNPNQEWDEDVLYALPYGLGDSEEVQNMVAEKLEPYGPHPDTEEYKEWSKTHSIPQTQNQTQAEADDYIDKPSFASRKITLDDGSTIGGKRNISNEDVIEFFQDQGIELTDEDKKMINNYTIPTRLLKELGLESEDDLAEAMAEYWEDLPDDDWEPVW